MGSRHRFPISEFEVSLLTSAATISKIGAKDRLIWYKKSARRTFYDPPGVDFHPSDLKEDDLIRLLTLRVRASGRMDLLIASIKRTTILNVRVQTGHRGTR